MDIKALIDLLTVWFGLRGLRRDAEEHGLFSREFWSSRRCLRAAIVGVPLTILAVPPLRALLIYRPLGQATLAAERASSRRHRQESQIPPALRVSVGDSTDGKPRPRFRAKAGPNTTVHALQNGRPATPEQEGDAILLSPADAEEGVWTTHTFVAARDGEYAAETVFQRAGSRLDLSAFQGDFAPTTEGGFWSLRQDANGQWQLVGTSPPETETGCGLYADLAIGEELEVVLRSHQGRSSGWPGGFAFKVGPVALYIDDPARGTVSAKRGLRLLARRDRAFDGLQIGEDCTLTVTRESEHLTLRLKGRTEPLMRQPVSLPAGPNRVLMLVTKQHRVTVTRVARYDVRSPVPAPVRARARAAVQALVGELQFRRWWPLPI